MTRSGIWTLTVMVVIAALAMGSVWGRTEGPQLPTFGKDTVLVWNMKFSEETTEFVVRIAQFVPDRYLEWENSTTQGTIFMTGKALMNGKVFVNASLFEGGVDTKGRDATTLWLSKQIFQNLKAKNRIKVVLDSVDGWLTLEGTDKITVTVNRSPMDLPVIKVKDERGSERWFLDYEDNPLLARHTVRQYEQSLASVTTDKENTLRWIKGKKLANPH
jgi:hypothetical protein